MSPAQFAAGLYEKFSVTKIEALTNANKIIIPIRRNLEFLTQVFPIKKLPPRKILIFQDTYVCISTRKIKI